MSKVVPPPSTSNNSLHAAVVEIYVKKVEDVDIQLFKTGQIMYII